MSMTTHSALAKDKRNATKADVMQHRHFAVVAGVIAKLPEGQIRTVTAMHFARELASTNSKFNRTRFLSACNITQ